MKRQIEINDNRRLDAQQAQVVKIIRFSGVMMMLVGLASFFDLGGLATAIGLGEANANMILGGTLMIAGLVEVIVLPRVFERAQKK